MKISEETFAKFASLISSIAGIELAFNREKMFVNRISSRLSALNIKTFEEYYGVVSCDNQRAERQALIDSVTTHFTSFFRDESQFTHVRSELVKLFNSGQRRIRLWSAACSSGEEPYSLAIVALEAAVQAGVENPDIRVLATDISYRVLKDAYSGWFPVASLKKLSAAHRTFFETTSTQCEVTGEPLVRVSKQLRDIVIFRKVNLCKQPLEVPSGIDIIFCRNVLLYFNVEKQKQILCKVADKLNPGGFVYVGASEQVRAYLPHLKSVRACVFRKPIDICQPEILLPSLPPHTKHLVIQNSYKQSVNLEANPCN